MRSGHWNDVDPEELEAIRRRLAKGGCAYTGTLTSGDLSGAIEDCAHGLDEFGFTGIEFELTDESRQMVLYRCRPAWTPHTAREVRARLEDAWVKQGAFANEVHCIFLQGTVVALEFATWWGSGQHNTFQKHYTGRIEVALENAPEVLQDYEPDHPRWRVRARANLIALSTEASPHDLELAISLPPDRKWARGEPISRRGGRHRYSAVQYNSRLGERQSPTDHAADLVERLRPHAAGIAEVSKRPTTVGVTLWVVEYTHADDRQIDVSPEDLKTIAAMGARLSLDLYTHDDDDGEVAGEAQVLPRL